jgi:hypothetical protein
MSSINRRLFLLTQIDDGQINGPLLTSIASEHQRRCLVLSADEHKAFAELRRNTEQVGAARPSRKTPLGFVVLWGISVLTVIVGATLPGIGMAVAVGLGWLLWRYVPTLADMLEAASEVSDDDYRDLR